MSKNDRGLNAGELLMGIIVVAFLFAIVGFTGWAFFELINWAIIK